MPCVGTVMAAFIDFATFSLIRVGLDSFRVNKREVKQGVLQDKGVTGRKMAFNSKSAIFID